MDSHENALENMKKAIDAFLMLPSEEQLRRIEECDARAKEISDRFDQAISFTSQEARDLLRRPITI